MEFTGYSTLWKAIIRPPKCEYEEKDLGPKDLMIERRPIVRNDFEILNHKGHVLKCSHFEPREDKREYTRLPCVVYLHGNSSSRLEAFPLVPIFLPKNITVVCFANMCSFTHIAWWYFPQKSCLDT